MASPDEQKGRGSVDEDQTPSSVTPETDEVRQPERHQTKAPVKKARPTRSQAEANAEKRNKDERTTPVKFAKQSVGELKKVKWPTGPMVRQYFLVVLVFVLFVMTFVAGLDWLFGWLVVKVLG